MVEKPRNAVTQEPLTTHLHPQITVAAIDVASHGPCVGTPRLTLQYKLPESGSYLSISLIKSFTV